MKPVLLCLIFFFFISEPGLTPAFGQTSQIQVDTNAVEFIVRAVVKKTKENDKIKKEKLSYKRVYTVDNLNDNGQIADRKKEEVAAIEQGGKERTIEKNGKPVKQGKVSVPKFDLIKALEAMVKLDDFNVAKIETLEERPCYVINFKPNPEQKANGDVEEVIIRSEGVMYVDIEKFYIKQFSAWMVRPYSRGGILGWNIFSLTQANIEMSQEEFNDIVIMKSVLITNKYSLFGSDTFEKQMYLYKDYQQGQE